MTCIINYPVIINYIQEQQRKEKQRVKLLYLEPDPELVSEYYTKE